MSMLACLLYSLVCGWLCMHFCTEGVGGGFKDEREVKEWKRGREGEVSDERGEGKGRWER